MISWKRFQSCESPVPNINTLGDADSGVSNLLFNFIQNLKDWSHFLIKVFVLLLIWNAKNQFLFYAKAGRFFPSKKSGRITVGRAHICIGQLRAIVTNFCPLHFHYIFKIPTQRSFYGYIILLEKTLANSTLNFVSENESLVLESNNKHTLTTVANYCK